MTDPNMLFDLNIKDTNIYEALDDFFAQAGRAFVVDDPIRDTVISVRVADVGFDDALKLLLPPDYEALEIGEIYHIHHVSRPVEQREF